MKNPFKNAQTIFAEEKITDFEIYANHPAVKAIFDGYAPSEFESHLKHSKAGFVQAYVVRVNPAENYGMEYVVYKVNKSFENPGLQFIRKVSAGSMLTSAPFKYVDLMEDGFTILPEMKAEKTEENRRKLAEMKATVIS